MPVIIVGANRNRIAEIIDRRHVAETMHSAKDSIRIVAHDIEQEACLCGTAVAKRCSETPVFNLGCIED
jgi:hypothetical protein